MRKVNKTNLNLEMGKNRMGKGCNIMQGGSPGCAADGERRRRRRRAAAAAEAMEEVGLRGGPPPTVLLSRSRSRR